MTDDAEDTTPMALEENKELAEAFDMNGRVNYSRAQNDLFWGTA